MRHLGGFASGYLHFEMKVTNATIRAAYALLKTSAFHDMKLPARVRLVARQLKDAYGYYYVPPHRIEIDATIQSADKFIRVVAHEMCHAVLEQNAACDHHVHDENFRQLANLICQRMGWRKGSV